MTSDDIDDALGDALPRCPQCLVLLDAEGDGYVLAWLECPSCGDVFL